MLEVVLVLVVVPVEPLAPDGAPGAPDFIALCLCLQALVCRHRCHPYGLIGVGTSISVVSARSRIEPAPASKRGAR